MGIILNESKRINKDMKLKVLVLYGSPKPNGNSVTITKHFLNGLNAQNNCVIQEFYLNKMVIKPCQGCYKCLETSLCIFNDDMHAIYEAINKADIVVFATPIYWWHMAAQMKLCIDRFTALLSKNDKLTALAGKHVVLTVTYNYEHCAIATIKMFEEFEEWIGAKLTVIKYCSKVVKNVSHTPGKLEEAYQIGLTIITQV